MDAHVKAAATVSIDRHEYEHALGLESSSTPPPGVATIALPGPLPPRPPMALIPIAPRRRVIDVRGPVDPGTIPAWLRRAA